MDFREMPVLMKEQKENGKKDLYIEITKVLTDATEKVQTRKEKLDLLEALIGTLENMDFQIYELYRALADCFKKVQKELLAEYEDLEEQGFILKAPCRINDTVYVKTRYSVARPYEIVECRVSKIAALSSGKGASITCAGRYENGNPYNGNFRISLFGKKVFTNKEEAEKHLND